MEDILDRLRDLHKQATTERSHYYVADTCAFAIHEIERLRKVIKNVEGLGLQACGHIANKGIAADYRKNIMLCQRE